MKTKFTDFLIFADSRQSEKAALLFIDEIKLRSGHAALTEDKDKADFLFLTDSRNNKDSFTITADDKVTFCAFGIRALIFAFGRFLRKTEWKNGEAVLTEDINGEYTPDKKIRGHQLGYRTTPNTYDAWSYEDYRRYYLDIMFMGANTVEHIPYEGFTSNRNRLMKYDEEEFLVEATRMADEFDLDVSLWYPNHNEESDEEAAQRRKKLLQTLPRVNIIFPPGGDPGNIPAADFIKRSAAIKKATAEVFPEIEMWPSAQAPHEIPNWGEELEKSLAALPEEIDGIITGPNHAFPMDELRRRVPAKYPLRFYPDITHNLRCEYPVHFDRDDWHFAIATGLGRECTNPRPVEYRRIHRLTRQYVCGSVSYSEGITDDVNKFIWSDMDFTPDVDLRESLLDYARLFFPGAPAEKLADGILRLELDWACDPAENPTIDSCYELFSSLASDFPFLNGNWRFDQLLLRAECDYVLRQRRLFEQKLIKKAAVALNGGDSARAREILSEEPGSEYKAVRADIDRLAEDLFNEIGLQLDIERYCANNWERGAILETIDLPVTDKAWILNRLDFADTLPEDERAGFLKRIISRNRVDSDEYYFSVAENGLAESGVPAQEGEVYFNFQGDRPTVNDGSVPTCLFNIYDNLSFRLKTGGFTANENYKLVVSFVNSEDKSLTDHRITVNGHTVYEGEQYGGERIPEYDKKLLHPRLVSVAYTIPAEYFVNGCMELEMREDKEGVMFAELRVIKESNFEKMKK